MVVVVGPQLQTSCVLTLTKSAFDIILWMLAKDATATDFSSLSQIRCFSLDVVDSIRLDHVGVPSYAIQGKQAVLECPYDLEGSSLYSVKWYKNGREFFRYYLLLHHGALLTFG